MALILLDARGVVSGLGAGAAAGPALLGTPAVGTALADRWLRLAAAGDADAAALHGALLELLGGRLNAFEYRHDGWRLGLQACRAGGAAAAVLQVDRLGGRSADPLPASPGFPRVDPLAQASHDFRTPLQAIVSLAHLLGRGLSDPAQRQRTQTIEQSAHRLGSMLDALLAQTRDPPPAGAEPPWPPPAAAAVADAGAQLRQRHGGRRVLVAEDDDVSRLALVELLTAAGLEVDTAADGHQAVERAGTRAYDLILLDLRMPQLDGIAAARVLRGMPGLRATPIVAVSANAFDEDRRACRAAGMDDFLAKPVDVPQLYALLLRWLDARAQGQLSAPGPAPGGAPAATDAASVALLLGAEGIDAVAGLASVGGKASVYRRLLQVFVDTHTGDGERLRQQLRCGEAAAAAALAHRLRGGAATLGLVDVEVAAAALEGVIDAGTAAPAPGLAARALADALAGALARLRAALAG